MDAPGSTEATVDRMGVVRAGFGLVGPAIRTLNTENAQ